VISLYFRFEHVALHEIKPIFFAAQERVVEELELVIALMTLLGLPLILVEVLTRTEISRLFDGANHGLGLNCELLVETKVALGGAQVVS